MMKHILCAFFFSGIMTIAMSSWAGPITVHSGDSMEKLLTAYVGKRVSIQTTSGKELGGTVLSVGEKLTHLGKLSGKEFYDAVIVNKNIEAVIIRTK